jgi:hypothetical protein
MEFNKMDKSAKMKNDVLEMLKQFMMGEHGKKLKPAAVTVEVITPVKKDSGSLDEVLDRAQESAPEVEDLAEEIGEPLDLDGDGDHDEDDHRVAESREDSDESEEKEQKYKKGGMVKRSPRDYFGC